MPSGANRVKENKDDEEEQEALEEGEKAGSNEAAVASGLCTDNPQQTVGIDCHEVARPADAAARGPRISR